MGISEKGPAPAFEQVLRRVSVRELRLLLAVARAGNMMKAAQDAGLSQPAVSKAIAGLESAFGTRLFDRDNRGVQPTPQGQIVIRRARLMFEEIRQAVEEIGFLASAASGELRVGATPSASAGLLAHAIGLLASSHPGLRYHAVEMEAGQLAAEVRDRTLDFAVGRDPGARMEDDLIFEPLFQDRVLVVAGDQHRVAKRRALRLDELVGEEWILPPEGSAVGREIEVAFARRKLALPQARITLMSTLMRYELLATQRYVTVLHGSLLRFGRPPSYIRVLPVDLGASVNTGLLRSRGRTLSPAAELLMDQLRALGKALAQRKAVA